ncbi:hypothetical protein L1987_30641 [Smallanthus sonchifolius]|uniref:Uncharacterized protein n=1 Tax=Smallanthus sonchifolius TaxID=185202 RepID=A0ACB9I2Q7_9ASTR|nr:hypothetical protein L1987_30641 [Smallanthus sonchifolius]
MDEEHVSDSFIYVGGEREAGSRVAEKLGELRSTAMGAGEDGGNLWGEEGHAYNDGQGLFLPIYPSVDLNEKPIVSSSSHSEGGTGHNLG